MKKKIIIGFIIVVALLLLTLGVRFLIWNLYIDPVRKDTDRNAGEVVYMENGERIQYKEGAVCYAQGVLVVFNNSCKPRTFKVKVHQPAGYFSDYEFIKTNDVEFTIDVVELAYVEKGTGTVHEDQTVTIGPFSKITLGVDSHYEGPGQVYTQRCAPDITFDLIN